MLFNAVLAALLLLATSSNSFAGALFDKLQGLSESDKKHHYQGIFILRKADTLSSLQVKHGHDGEGAWESMEALNGEPKKVVRRNNQVISILPARELVTIRHDNENQSLHFQLPDNIEKLAPFYTLQQLPNDRIARHPALVFDLIPNDKLRYGFRYWVDENTGMLLRCDLIDENNKVVEQMMFTTLEYLAQTPEQSFDVQQYQHFQQQRLDEAEIEVEHSAPLKWAINVLPKGFALTQRTLRYRQYSPAENTVALKDRQADLLHLVYSDGLASVSVFIEKKQGAKKHVQGGFTKGAVNAFGNPVAGYFVTVVGEVPAKTVQTMALSTVKLQ